ncbi:MAG: EscU/YscU/HrcU family type III secretion system export apparatus switch protein [Pseudomonadota bacterium]
MSMSGDKRHPPSRHKLKEAKKRGEIAYSRDLTGAAGFICALAAGWITRWTDHLKALLDLALLALPNGTTVTLMDRSLAMTEHALWLSVPALVAAAAGALMMGMLQARGVMSADPLKLRFERLNPAEGLKRIFSSRQLIEVLKLVLKSIVLTAVLLWVLQGGMEGLVKNLYAPAAAAGSATLDVLKLLFGGSALVFLLFGVVDFAHQYYEHLKQNRMTDVERKREYRDLEGDPHAKAELKAQRKALLMAPMTPNPGMAGASVLLTNPTHYAVALYFEAGVVELPVLVAKGADEEARQLRREAQRLSIPIMENPPLTRALFREVALRQYIGEDHIEPVAEIFRWLQSLRQASAARN